MSKSIQNDESAFPGFQYTEGRGNAKSVQGPNGIEWEYYAPGISKRELFTAMAMQGLIAYPGVIAGAGETNPESAAKRAVEYADALIAELGKDAPVESVYEQNTAQEMAREAVFLRKANEMNKATLHDIEAAIEGLIDGSPDASAASKLANTIQRIIERNP